MITIVCDRERIEAVADETRMHLRGRQEAHEGDAWRPVQFCSASSKEGDQAGDAPLDIEGSRSENVRNYVRVLRII